MQWGTANPTTSSTPASTDVPTKVPTKVPTNVPSLPTKLPTSVPTKGPTNVPTSVPTKGPTSAPTNVPTNVPTKGPTKGPTNVPSTTPTIAPSKGPTPAPIGPGPIQCGDISTGDYNGAELTFSVSVPFDGDLTFDASSSTPSIAVNGLQKLNPGGILDNGNGDNNAALGAISLGVVAGTYAFSLDLGVEKGQYGVSTRCTSVAPTRSPSAAPTRYPTISPSSAPTWTPSAATTWTPTVATTWTQTAAPTFSPTSAPTFSPTSPPTFSPTSAPTRYPIVTNSPTDAPSVSPSNAPTFSPTTAPTRFPTMEDAYDSYIGVVYLLKDLLRSNIASITGNAVGVMHDIERLIERAYVEQEEIIIDFKAFWIRILRIDDNDIDDEDESWIAELQPSNERSQAVRLQSEILCNAAECKHLISKRDDDALSTVMTAALRGFFAKHSVDEVSLPSQSVVFEVESMDESPSLLHGGEEEVQLDVDDDETNSNYFFYISLLVMFVVFVLALYAHCFNFGVGLPCPKVPGSGCRIVDDGDAKAILLFAVHLLDFWSDINLTITIWLSYGTHLSFEHLDQQQLLICIAGIGSIVFLVIPYLMNLYYASKMKEYIDNRNEIAQQWFERYSKVFNALVLLSGGSYVSMLLCSSNVFGIDAFCAGLTRLELKKMSKIRILANTIMENIPQIAIQILFTMTIGNANVAVVFAFVASVLSVLSTLMNYYADRERDPTGGTTTHVVWYYLVLQLHQHNQGQYKISAAERKAIKTHQGRRKALIAELSELFSVPPRDIEITGTVTTKYGAIVYLSQIVHETTLLLMSSDGKDKDVAADHDSLAHLYLSQLYDSHRTQVHELFRNHFRLSNKFFVKQQYKLSTVRRGTWIQQGQDHQAAGNWNKIQSVDDVGEPEELEMPPEDF